MPDIISEFRKRYPQYSDIPDPQVYMKLADPKMFKQVFPEYQDFDEHEIGKNIAAEAGKVDTGKPWYKTAWEDVAGMAKEIVHPSNQPKRGETIEQWQARLGEQKKQNVGNREFRKEQGYSLPYRATANTLEGLGLFSPAAMEQAAAKGHMGEVAGHFAAAELPATLPLVIPGVKAARRVVGELAMEEPVVARQQAFNVAAKSKQAVRAQKEGTAAAPYLKGAKNLADVQARIPAAKQEIFQPYMDAVSKHDATGRMLQAPDGSPVTAVQLEELRQQTSAQLQATRKMQPTEQWTAVQKGQQIADLTNQYRQITSELDPAIKNQGIDPKRTRATFGAVKGVEKRFEGRSTLLENKPSGLGKAMQVDITKPFKDIGNVAEGARDIVAGRGWFKQKPTDIQVREGFRAAGPKPDLTVQPQPPARGLPPGPLVTPPPPPGPPNLNAPAYEPTTRAIRRGLLLPEQSVSSARPQIPTGYTEPAAPGAVHYAEAPPATPPPVPTEPPTGQPANMRIVRDPATGQMKRQYLTSAGGEIVREAPATKPVVAEPKIFVDSIGIKWAETPEGIRVSIPKGIREENVMQYAQNKLAHQAEMQKGVKSQVEPVKESPVATGNISWNELKTKNPNVSDISVSINKGGGPIAETTLSVVNKEKGILSTENLEVLPEYRKQGLATKLYEQMFDEAARKGFKRINSADSMTSEGQSFWDSLQRKYPDAITTYGEGRTNRNYSIDLTKWNKESPAAAAKARGAELQAGRKPIDIERRLSSTRQRVRFDMHQAIKLDLQERLRNAKTAESKETLRGMIAEQDRSMEAVKSGDPTEMARDFGPIQFQRAEEAAKEIKGISGIKKARK